MADFVEKYKRSWAALKGFLARRTTQIQHQAFAQGSTNDQRQAAFYLWARYSMSVRTIRPICEPPYLPDLFVIARCCLEYDASLHAVISKPECATKYLDHQNQAKAAYAKILEGLGESKKLADLARDLESAVGENWRREARYGWCNVSDLIEEYGGPDERRLYALYSHFVHGSIVALKLLDHRIPDPVAWFNLCIQTVYTSYLTSTSDFLEFIWGPIVTQDSEGCKSEFLEIFKAFLINRD